MRPILALLAVAALPLVATACRSGEGPGPATDVTITRIEPESGPRKGGNPVRVEGSGFGRDPFVTLGGANVQEFLLVTDQAIEFVAPAQAVGPANLTVVASEGGRRTVLDAYFYLPLPARPYERRYFADAAEAAGANVVVVTSSETVSLLDVEVPRAESGTIEGTLTGPAAQPLPGHAVVARRLDGAYPQVSFVSGPAGAYRIDGLPPGDWIVTSAQPPESILADEAWPDAFDLSGADPVAVTAGETAAGVDLSLEEGGTIGGLVTADGLGLAGATVYAVMVPANSLQFTYAVTGESGEFFLRGLAPGSYRLLAFAFGTGRINEYYEDSLDAASATLIPLAGGESVEILMDLDEAGSVAGSVTEDGAESGPLPGVVVIAREIDLDLNFSGATGVDGTFVIAGLPPGQYRLHAPEIGQYHPGVTGTSGATVLTIAAGQTASGNDFVGRLGSSTCDDPATGTVSGEVLGAGGAKVLRAVAQLIPVNGGVLTFAVSGLDGRWNATCVAPGEYQVQVVAPASDLVRQTWSTAGAGGSPGVVVVASGGTVSDIDVALTRGAVLEGQVRDGVSHMPLAGVPVRVSNTSTGDTATTATGGDGRYRVDRTSQGGLLPGDWTIEARPHLQLDHGG